MTQQGKPQTMAERWKMWVDSGGLVLTIVVTLFAAGGSYGAGQYHWGQTDDEIRQIKIDAAEYKRTNDIQISTLNSAVKDLAAQNTATYGAVKEVAGEVGLLSKQLTFVK